MKILGVVVADCRIIGLPVEENTVHQPGRTRRLQSGKYRKLDLFTVCIFPTRWVLAKRQPTGSPASNAVGELLAQRRMIDWQHTSVSLRLCGWRVPTSFPEYCRAVVPNVKSLTSSIHSIRTLLGMRQFWGQPTNAATPR